MSKRILEKVTRRAFVPTDEFYPNMCSYLRRRNIVFQQLLDSCDCGADLDRWESDGGTVDLD